MRPFLIALTIAVLALGGTALAASRAVARPGASSLPAATPTWVKAAKQRLAKLDVKSASSMSGYSRARFGPAWQDVRPRSLRGPPAARRENAPAGARVAPSAGARTLPRARWGPAASAIGTAQREQVGLASGRDVNRAFLVPDSAPPRRGAVHEHAVLKGHSAQPDGRGAPRLHRSDLSFELAKRRLQRVSDRPTLEALSVDLHEWHDLVHGRRGERLVSPEDLVEEKCALQRPQTSSGSAEPSSCHRD